MTIKIFCNFLDQFKKLFVYNYTPCVIRGIQTNCNSCIIKQPGDKNTQKEQYSPEIDKNINKQINYELKASHVYLSMANFFTAENPLDGFAALYLSMSTKQRSNALILMCYQNQRGGNNILADIHSPESSWRNVMNSLEFAINLETENSIFLKSIYDIAKSKSDMLTMDLIASKILREKVKSIYFLNNTLAQLHTGDSIIIEQFINNELRKKYVKKSTQNLTQLISDLNFQK